MMAQRVRVRQRFAPVLWAAAALGAAHVPPVLAVLPALAILRGPVGVGLALLAVTQAAARSLPPLVANVESRVSAHTVAYAAAFLLYASVGLWYTTRLRVTGDEPHYLLMAQSLWRERDLDLQDNYAREDWREYTPGPIVPHYGAPRADGRPFPAHSPGLSALLAAPYAAGGRIACVIVLAAIAAGVPAVARALALRHGARAEAAWFAWTTALGPPVFFYGFHVYTEPASGLALFGALAVVSGGGTWPAGAAAGLAAGTLPWLHVKMIAAAAAVGMVAVARLRGRALLAFGAGAGAMAAAYLVYLQHVFGRPTPLAIYHGSPAQMSGSPLAALAGLALDRSFGLLPYAPVFLLALAGFVPLGRHWRETWPLLVAAVAVLGPVLPWRMWWGGQSPPARFLVPMIPALAVAAAARVVESPRGLARWRWPLAVSGLAIGLFAAARPGDLLLVNRGDRPTRLWAALSGDGAIERYLPSLVSGAAQEWRVAAAWAALLAGLLLLDRVALRRDRVDGAFRSLGLPLGAALLVSVLVDHWARLE